MDIRDKTWFLLCNAKFKEYCLEHKLRLFQLHDRNINIFLAITSSGSIAGWVIWDQLFVLWAVIIALSQLINVVKPYFPFQKYARELYTKIVQIQNLNIEFEKFWTEIQNDELTQEQAEDTYFKLKRELVEIERFRNDVIIRISERTQAKANKKMVSFLKNTYNVELKLNDDEC